VAGGAAAIALQPQGTCGAAASPGCKAVTAEAGTRPRSGRETQRGFYQHTENCHHSSKANDTQIQLFSHLVLVQFLIRWLLRRAVAPCHRVTV